VLIARSDIGGQGRIAREGNRRPGVRGGLASTGVRSMTSRADVSVLFVIGGGGAAGGRRGNVRVLECFVFSTKMVENGSTTVGGGGAEAST
jgi:hypothetical protein